MPHKCFNPVASEMAMTFLSFSSESFQMGEMEINITLTFETCDCQWHFLQEKNEESIKFYLYGDNDRGDSFKPFPQHKVNA